jgi:hypothetical protein
LGSVFSFCEERVIVTIDLESLLNVSFLANDPMTESVVYMRVGLTFTFCAGAEDMFEDMAEDIVEDMVVAVDLLVEGGSEDMLVKMA